MEFCIFYFLLPQYFFSPLVFLPGEVRPSELGIGELTWFTCHLFLHSLLSISFSLRIPIFNLYSLATFDLSMTPLSLPFSALHWSPSESSTASRLPTSLSLRLPIPHRALSSIIPTLRILSFPFTSLRLEIPHWKEH
ncbi:uncharacterized protein BDV14DRAFT_107261 [Aspergillus stella-maris]|uniref:uncharacterized protein n=1 Tax=Aspergillus stella-maris TaxID=1810926 RepID=UPI003CCE21EB